MSNKRSLFDQSLDRSVFVTYFLGGIVPLLGLAFLGERVIPDMPDREAQVGSTALIAAIGLLSLASFFALSRIVTGAVARMDADNQRLAALLGVARELTEAPHSQVVIETTLNWASTLSGADAVWILSRADASKDLAVVGERGDSAGVWYDAHHADWDDLVSAAIRDGRELTRLQAAEPGSISLMVVLLEGDMEQESVLLVARDAADFSVAEGDSLTALAAQARIALANADLRDVQRNFFSHMTDLVIVALDSHVQYRDGHSKRVAEISNRVGREMGLGEKALHDLHFAALLHDVGMLRIPLEQQRNPQYFRKHPIVGHRMLSRIRVWKDVAPIVHQHHERMDGCGYPDGLLGDEIGMGARILAVCDGWDAMQSVDQHRGALSVPDALTELERNAGTQFDPDVVATVIRLVRQGAL